MGEGGACWGEVEGGGVVGGDGGERSGEEDGGDQGGSFHGEWFGLRGQRVVMVAGRVCEARIPRYVFCVV